ncbi:MAG TPA: thioesterase family protein [Ignavibacteria bacterium]|nr:thioesterase family protein [Ignavibacteria bacterium]
MIETVTEFRVLYAHTDKMGVVNNARYFEYFEAGRNDFLRKVGYPYTELEKENIGLPVIEAYAKYISGAKYDDVISIRTILKNLPGVSFKIEYEITCDNKLIASGFTVHAFVDFIKMKPVRPPHNFIDLIRSKF